jgi:hypothetical protein
MSRLKAKRSDGDVLQDVTLVIVVVGGFLTMIRVMVGMFV